MKLKIITNNPRIVNQADIEKDEAFNYFEQYELEYLETDAISVFQYGKNLITVGWKLAADPLAGRHFKGNPYHTLFLTKNLNEEMCSSDILKLESCACRLMSPRFHTKITKEMKGNYEDLDYSIAMETIRGIVQKLSVEIQSLRK